MTLNKKKWIQAVSKWKLNSQCAFNAITAKLCTKVKTLFSIAVIYKGKCVFLHHFQAHYQNSTHGN